MDWNYRILSMVAGPEELVPNVHGDSTARFKHPRALEPNAAKILEVLRVAFLNPDLARFAIVLDRPVGRRGHDQLDRGGRQVLQDHPGIALDQRLFHAFSVALTHLLDWPSRPSTTHPPGTSVSPPCGWH
jgi:hypothetical protein